MRSGFSFSGMLFKNNCQNCYWHKLQGFRGSNHHWAYNHADIYCLITVHYQNIKVFSSLNISFFCFEKLLLTWSSKNLCGSNHVWDYNHADTWNISTIHFPSMHLVCWRVIVQSRSHWIRSDVIQNKHLTTRQKLFDVTIKFHAFKLEFKLKFVFQKKNEKWNLNPCFKFWKMKKCNFHFPKN